MYLCAWVIEDMEIVQNTFICNKEILQLIISGSISFFLIKAINKLIMAFVITNYPKPDIFMKPPSVIRPFSP